MLRSSTKFLVLRINLSLANCSTVMHHCSISTGKKLWIVPLKGVLCYQTHVPSCFCVFHTVCRAIRIIFHAVGHSQMDAATETEIRQSANHSCVIFACNSEVPQTRDFFNHLVDHKSRYLLISKCTDSTNWELFMRGFIRGNLPAASRPFKTGYSDAEARGEENCCSL